jgi:hypothetical protein
MQRLLILLVFVVVPTVGVFAEGDSASAVTPYLGLSLPYPDTVSPWLVKPKPGLLLKVPTLPVTLLIGGDGRVTDIQCSPDRLDYIEAIRSRLGSLYFQYTPGKAIPFPVALPVEVRFSVQSPAEWRADPVFPISPGLISDSTLFRLMLEKNGIRPPAVISLPSVFYKPDPSMKNPEYLTITARITIDDSGKLADITYPIQGQDRMTHQVQVALMNAQFSPLIINGQPLPAEFFLTFRIFDNLQYPFSPLSTSDSTDTLPLTARYFLTQSYCANDISIPPLPRNHPKGYIHTAAFGKNRIGAARVKVTIDETGAVAGVLPLTASPAVSDIVRDVIRLTTWYPAVTAAGKRDRFSGAVWIQFDGTPQVVYNPEWLSR